ncbi:MAG: hypothetical protein HY782_06735 [Chloroflexi bacterium]|nr:hypothetical protein [Chloroflexota bacterium]
MPEMDRSVSATSPGAGQLQISADRGSVSILPGAQERIMLTLRNTSGSGLSVELAAAGPPSQWLSLSQSALPLAPAQSVRVTLTLSPSSDAPTGSYPLDITAQSRDDAMVKVELELIFEIAEPGEITVQVMPPQAEAQVSTEFEVRLTQSGSTPLGVTLAASGDQAACNFTFHPPTLLVPPQGTVSSRLTVSARQPLAGVDSRTWPFTVTATATEGAAGKSQAQARFIQKQIPPLALALTPPRQSGPGMVSYTVRISNPSQSNAVVRVAASDSQGACRYQFDPASLTVPAGGAATATLQVTPLRYHSDPGDKPHVFTVRAEPTEGLLPPAKGEGTFLQTAMERPVMSLSPSSQSSAGAATYTVLISNPRTTPLQVELKPSAGDGMSEIAVNPTHTTVPAHGHATARLTVRPTSGLLPGETRRTCAFSVQLHAPDLEEPIKSDGSLVQVQGVQVGRILGIAAVGALALVACLAALWIGSTVLSVLGSGVSNIANLQLPTPLPLATPLPIPSDTPTLVPTAVPTPAPPSGAPPQQPTQPPKATPDAGATQQAAADKTAAAKDKAAATQTAAAQKTLSAQQTATAKAQQTAQAARFSQYNGNWFNDDANTNGITRLQITNSNATISVHGFGKCTPTDCDWGTRSGAFTSEPFKILFDFGGGLTHQLTLTKEGTKLKVVDVGSASGARLYTFHTVTIIIDPVFRPTFIVPIQPKTP